MSYLSSPRSSPASSTTMATTRATTPPSSPPPDTLEIKKTREETVEDNEEIENRMQILSSLLEKSAAYVSVLKEQMDKVKVDHSRRNAAKITTATEPNPNSESVIDKSKKRTHVHADPDETQTQKRIKLEKETSEDGSASHQIDKKEEEAHAFQQPALITGATLKEYQLEGVAWMAGLYQSGISGILADEMGLGKTLQTIAFHAFLRERTPAPFLVVCPLSVLNNWVEEFRRFAPAIPVCMYHGSPEDRAELRRTVMVFSEEDMKYQHRMFGRKADEVAVSSQARKAPRTKTRGGAGKGKGRASIRGRASAKKNESDDKNTPAKVNVKVPGSTKIVLPPYQRTNFPVVITTYEMVMKDRAQLAEYYWGFIVVDEGHRLKNMDCKLMREIKRLNAAARIVLTGTPLHNNLAELWALLNFVLPDLFSDLEAFEEWFNLPMLQSTLSPDRSSQLIHSLHSILRPFLLRRLKVDVETDLPPKKEYVLYAPLSERQREVYNAVIDGRIRELLVKQGSDRVGEPGHSPVDEDEEVPLKSQVERRNAEKKGEDRPRLRQSRRTNYAVDGDDDEYFAKLESGEIEAQKQREKEKSVHEIGTEWQHKSIRKRVNNMKLQNTVMQLRKVCSHPFLFDWPVDPDTHQPVLNEELVSTSGKMMILDRLLDELFNRKHKVLLFSQFTTMLDIIEDWAVEFKGWSICRIDGSTSMLDRREEVDRFQNGGDAPDAPYLFLLSTRAGGLGLNLVAADTVIFYDQDWNPQMDLQAQDRAHRIGQTKPKSANWRP
ncbi:hypothetical protein AcW1_003212 [Taiwanofungus camphoratus]|nr:hypothetical protein AcV5_001599 [Antrodia cinnamomea]KAI0942636.1 hypothetical protein AcW1_003212 [Antrodia cinnamomea]